MGAPLLGNQHRAPRGSQREEKARGEGRPLAAKQESADVAARQNDAPFVGSGGTFEPEHRLADTPSRLDAVEAALAAAGVLKRP